MDVAKGATICAMLCIRKYAKGATKLMRASVHTIACLASSHVLTDFVLVYLSRVYPLAQPRAPCVVAEHRN